VNPDRRIDRRIGPSERWFRLLLWLYPPDFRDEMGEPIVKAYAERAREASRDGVLRLAGVWFTALRDSLSNGLGERARPAASWRRSGDWGRDLELISRRFRQKPFFLLAVLATLTVGLGTFAVVYTAVDKILLDPLPYREPNGLYRVWAEVAQLNLREGFLSGRQIAELQKAGGVIEDAVGMGCGHGAIPSTDNRDAFHINSMESSPNLLEVLGVHPALGRGFRPEEGNIPSPPIVLGDTMWRRLGANPAIIGTQLRIGPDSHTVIGVMPPDFGFSCSSSERTDVYAPFNLALRPDSNFLTLIRARHDGSPEQVRQAVAAVGRTLVERDPKKSRGLTLRALGFQADLVKEVRPALLALSFAAVFLLLLLTANLASLLLGRAAEREREFAVSRALGASGPAIVRATLLEGGLLGLLGGVIGTLVGIWGTRLLVALGPLDLPRRETIALDGSVAVVVILVGVLLGLIAAAVPAVWVARISLGSLVSASAVRGGARSGRMRRSLIVAQVALSLVLLSTGGLVLRSFERLLAADPGFKPEHVLTLRLSTIVFTQPADAAAFLDRATAALRTLPGVTSVSAASNLPLSGTPNNIVVSFPSAPGNAGDDRDHPLVDWIRVRAGYVQAMGMHLLAGRDFDAARPAGVYEALIDRHLANQFFPGSSPLGATLLFNNVPLTVVGVVDQARLYGIYQDGRPQVFFPSENSSSRGYWFFVVRADRDLHTLIPEARSAIRSLERRIPVSQMLTMDEIVADARSRERISAVLLAGLAVGALLLVAMGLFGMISGSVARRRGELAVRMALGATHHRVIRLVTSEGARLLALGLLLGAPGVYLDGQALRGFLIGVSPFDAPTLAAVVIGLFAVALLACYSAARRVTRIEPERLLREGGC
jgi:putative ABC transport system permease protein